MIGKIISHPTKDCIILRDKLQALVDIDVLCLIKEKKSYYKYAINALWEKIAGNEDAYWGIGSQSNDTDHNTDPNH